MPHCRSAFCESASERRLTQLTLPRGRRVPELPRVQRRLASAAQQRQKRLRTLDGAADCWRADLSCAFSILVKHSESFRATGERPAARRLPYAREADTRPAAIVKIVQTRGEVRARRICEDGVS